MYDIHDIAELFGRDFAVELAAAEAELARAAAGDAALASQGTPAENVEATEADPDDTDTMLSTNTEATERSTVHAPSDATAVASPRLSNAEGDIRLNDLVAALGRDDRLPTEEEITVWAAVGRDGSARATAAWLLLGKAAFECTDRYGGIEKAQARVMELSGYGRSHVQQARQIWEHVVEHYDGTVPAAWLTMSQGEVKDLAQPYRRPARSSRPTGDGFGKALDTLVRRATRSGAVAKELARRLREAADALDPDTGNANGEADLAK